MKCDQNAAIIFKRASQCRLKVRRPEESIDLDRRSIPAACRNLALDLRIFTHYARQPMYDPKGGKNEEERQPQPIPVASVYFHLARVNRRFHG
jgi:hypothetical protein